MLRPPASPAAALWREPPTPVRRGPKRLSAETNAAIVADYQSGLKSTQIARKYGINEWTVHHRLKRSGVAKCPGSMSEPQIALAVMLRTGGLSCAVR